MYNKHLKTFLTVADCGSLTKAADILFVSSTALMKQINQLESDLDVQLFVRTNKGVQLSEAGKLLYEESKALIEHSTQVLDRARQAAQSEIYTVYIGTSLLHPVQEMEALLEKITLQDARFIFTIVPYQDEWEQYAHTLNSLGEHIDVVVSNYGFSNTKKPFNHILPLSAKPIQIAVPKRHPLAARKCLHLGDLNGQTVYVPQLDYSDIMQGMLDTLRGSGARLQYVNQRTFDFALYNTCARDGALTLTLTRPVHPQLAAVPIDWAFTVPYGILYPAQPNASTRALIRAAAELTGQKLPKGI